MFAQSRGIPKGAILLWSGSIASIPAGWQICNGSNGTPDLRNRFIVGAGDTYVVDASGGSLTHNHDFTGAGHMHTLESGALVSAGGDYSNDVGSDAVYGTTDAGNGLPPYYALAYIMKL